MEIIATISNDDLGKCTRFFLFYLSLLFQGDVTVEWIWIKWKHGLREVGDDLKNAREIATKIELTSHHENWTYVVKLSSTWYGSSNFFSMRQLFSIWDQQSKSIQPAVNFDDLTPNTWPIQFLDSHKCYELTHLMYQIPRHPKSIAIFET